MNQTCDSRNILTHIHLPIISPSFVPNCKLQSHQATVYRVKITIIRLLVRRQCRGLSSSMYSRLAILSMNGRHMWFSLEKHTHTHTTWSKPPFKWNNWLLQPLIYDWNGYAIARFMNERIPLGAHMQLWALFPDPGSIYIKCEVVEIPLRPHIVTALNPKSHMGRNGWCESVHGSTQRVSG